MSEWGDDLEAWVKEDSTIAEPIRRRLLAHLDFETSMIGPDNEEAIIAFTTALISMAFTIALSYPAHAVGFAEAFGTAADKIAERADG